MWGRSFQAANYQNAFFLYFIESSFISSIFYSVHFLYNNILSFFSLLSKVFESSDDRHPNGIYYYECLAHLVCVLDFYQHCERHRSKFSQVNLARNRHVGCELKPTGHPRRRSYLRLRLMSCLNVHPEPKSNACTIQIPAHGDD